MDHLQKQATPQCNAVPQDDTAQNRAQNTVTAQCLNIGDAPEHSDTHTQKNTFRLAPCPSYDIEGLESWLSDCAAAGLCLKQHGVHLGVFCFTKEAPQQRIYRLEATKNPSIFCNENNMPTEDVVALYHELGWDYVARYQNFDIYCTENATVRELNTDPTLQALTLNMVKKRQLWALLPLILQTCLYVCLMRKEVLLTMLTLGTPLALLITTMFLYWLSTSAAEVLHLSKLRKQLQVQGALSHRKNWKAHQKQHFLRSAFNGILSLILIAGLWNTWNINATNKWLTSMANYDQDPPFATLSDLMGETATFTYTPQDAFEEANTVTVWQDLLAPQNIEWTEVVTISQDGTVVLDAYYTVEYHQLANAFLATRLAKEYSNQIANGFSRAETPALTSTPDANYFAIYDTYLGVSFVIQQGNNVAKVTFYNYASDNIYNMEHAPFTLEECIETIAQSIR